MWRSDFGVSREMTDASTMTVVGTPAYLAPQVLRGERYDTAADVWSLGCLLCVLWTHASAPETADAWWFEPTERNSTGRTASISSSVSDRPTYRSRDTRSLPDQVRMTAAGGVAPRLPSTSFLAELVARCCSLCPEERPIAQEVVALLQEPAIATAAIKTPPGPQPGLEEAPEGDVLQRWTGHTIGDALDEELTHGRAMVPDETEKLDGAFQQLLHPSRPGRQSDEPSAAPTNGRERADSAVSQVRRPSMLNNHL